MNREDLEQRLNQIYNLRTTKIEDLMDEIEEYAKKRADMIIKTNHQTRFLSPRKYKSISIEVEAIRWGGNSNKQDVELFCQRHIESELESETAYVAGQGQPMFSLLIHTKEGVMKAMPGDWIVKEPFPTGDRDFYPVKDEIFRKKYELIV